MTRKEIPKRVRFEVFKRDKFTCQYCGASAPDVSLEIDHINPVAKGGTNEILNLVTACRDCNRGKTDRELSDNSVIKLQKQQLEDMQERREQFRMMLKWKNDIENIVEDEVDAVENFFLKNTTCRFNTHGRTVIKRLIKRFGMNEVYEATEIAIYQYYRDDTESAQNAFNKIGGICYNRWKAREQDAE